MGHNRVKPEQHLISDLLQGAILPDCNDALDALDEIVERYELSAGQVRNLVAAQKELNKAIGSLQAALVVTKQQEVR